MRTHKNASQAGEAEAKHHEMEAARRVAAEKAKDYEGVRAQVPYTCFLVGVQAMPPSAAWLLMCQHLQAVCKQCLEDDLQMKSHLSRWR